MSYLKPKSIKKYALLGGILPLLIACNTTADFTGTAQPSGISGTTSQSSVVLSAGSNYGLTSIAWAEENNQPCYIKATFRDLDDTLTTETAQNTKVEYFNQCNGSTYSQSSMLTVKVPPLGVSYDINNSSSFVGDPLKLFVNEIKTCDSKSNSNNRIKGLQIGGAFLTGVEPSFADYTCRYANEGFATREAACQSDFQVRSDQEVRNNCDNSGTDRSWNSLEQCDSGMIASELVVHYFGNEIVGLGLNCQAVVLAEQE